jgi:ubiquinol-cytochrome c reductase iron-sulfur subunit
MPDESAGNGSGAAHGSRGSVSVDSPQFEVAARHPARTEKLGVLLFFGSFACFGAFGGAFWENANNEWLGGTLGLGLFLLGAGMVVWGKYLMPRGPFEEPQALMATTQEERDALIGDFATRGRVAIKRRTMLAKTMGLATGVFGVVALFPLIRSLGPLPKNTFYTTKWRRGSYLSTADGRRMKADDIVVGAAITVFPQNALGDALSQTMLIHAQPSGNIITKPGRETWGPDGYLAFSKVCTHAGCPVGLYDEETQILLCPCHQSIFDLYKGAQPIFGPAPRPLAQLPLYIDAKGYIRAQAGYDEPIGPGFWERGGTT